MSPFLKIREIYFCPTKNNIAASIMIGDVAVTPALKPIDSCTNSVITGEVADQVRATLENLDFSLEAAGMGRGTIAQARFFMQRLTERVAIDPLWEERYPNPQNRPSYKSVPANLPEGMHVMLQVIAVRDARRRGLEVVALLPE